MCTHAKVLRGCLALCTHHSLQLQGLSEDVSINKFFDEPMLLKLADTEVDDPIAALMGGF
jgi:hypothetical protein